jgi:sulfur carrier protein
MDMMQIVVNGQSRQVEAGLTIERILDSLKIENRNLAVEYNGNFLEPDDLGWTLVQPGDRLEIVRFVGGG